MAKDLKTGEEVVIKYYRKQNFGDYDALSLELILQEFNLLNLLKHPGIVVCYGHGEDDIKSISRPPVRVYYLVLEYLAGGALFEFVLKNKLPEPLICYIFEELLKIIDFVHSKGFAHLDIKLENIMIAKNGRLKFIDFGLTKTLSGEEGKGKLFSFVGTKMYKSPEINEQTPYSGFMADAFALGVVLFACLARMFPFQVAIPRDPTYKMISEEDYETYWAKMNKTAKGIFSLSLMSLLNGIFAYNPLARLTIPEITHHEWIIKTHKPNEAEACKMITTLCSQH